MVLQNSTNKYSNSRYIVDNVSPGSPYTTIQAAINAANAAGGNATVWVKSGTYTENLTLYSTVNVEGADSTLTVIMGTHVPPASGAFTFGRRAWNKGRKFPGMINSGSFKKRLSLRNK